MTIDNSLRNFYESLKFSNPTLATRYADDVTTVAVNALGEDKSGGQESATRLRKRVLDDNLPEVLVRILNNALTEMGYS